MTSKLSQLRQMSVVVADTGDIEAVRRLRPQDCTTNPSIVLKSIQSVAFQEHLAAAVRGVSPDEAGICRAVEILSVDVGVELAKLVPGRVSTEVDARLSFDLNGSIAKARSLVEDYAKRGVSQDRILIKLAATWEGIQAAKVLQREGIDCNLTLIFSLTQAKACADAGAFLISPFVGRITDWHSKATGLNYTPENDPGVISVRGIYAHFKASGIQTVVMGASFRHVGQIEALAGCDRLTISPGLLEELENSSGLIERQLVSAAANTMDPTSIDEATFRWELNEDPMATEKLAEGIRNFNADTKKLFALIKERKAAAGH